MTRPLALLVSLFLSLGLAGSAQQAPAHVIGFMTDFDVKDDAVGLCKAVMDGVAPGVRVIDLTHRSRPLT